MKTLAIIATVALVGCAASPPLNGNARGGVIDLRLAYPNDVVFATADRHCAQYGKRARMTSMRTLDNHNALFECS